MADKGVFFIDSATVNDVLNDFFASREGDITDSEDEEVGNVEVNVDIEDDEGALEVIEEQHEQARISNLNSFISTDIEVEEHIDHQQRCSCKCKRGKGNARCIEGISNMQIARARLAMAELSNEGRDCAILSAIQVGFHDSQQTQCRKRSSQSDRQSNRTDYHFLTIPVCQFAFSYLYGIGVTTLKVLVKHFAEHKSLVPRKLHRGNQVRISYEQSVNFSSFMKNYLEQYSLVLPGRISGISRQTTEVLPSYLTKKKVYETYCKALANDSPISRSSFGRLWKLLFPSGICKPMSDLCWTCQKNNTVIY